MNSLIVLEQRMCFGEIRMTYGRRSLYQGRGLQSGLHPRRWPTHPVVQVADEDAMAYAARTGKDLPTEAEWEFAARGRERQ